MTALVLDASVAAAWILPDEHSEPAETLRSEITSQEVITPLLWWAETRNLLIVAERRGRIDPSLSDQALAEMRRLPIILDTEPNEKALMALARAHRLSIYDALYLELAKRKGATLATLDKQLAQAARAERVDLVF